MMIGIKRIIEALKKLVINTLRFIGEKLVIILNIIFVLLIYFLKDDGFLFLFFFVFEFAKWCRNVIMLEKEKDKTRKLKLKKRFTSRDEEGNVIVKKSDIEKCLMYLCSIEEHIYND